MDALIPPEILNDEFYFTLTELASRPQLKTFLEIGSSSGAGSTQAFVSAIRRRPDRDAVRLFCLELSRPRFAALAETYRNDPFVHCFNVSSVGADEFPSAEEVSHFYQHTRTNLNGTPLERVLEWRRVDIEYVRNAGGDGDGIATVKRSAGVADFDCVLIDGSEFTGERELHKVMGARVIALDDVNAFKCFNAYCTLSNHTAYELIRQNLGLRNGFAVFGRRF